MRATLVALLVGGVLGPVVAGAGPSGPAAAEPDRPGGPGSTRLADPEITESSGLVVTAELLVTVNDSGDTGRVFTVDRDSGETVGVTRWGEQPEDVEALAPAGDEAVWVGDHGDNARHRADVRVARVPTGRGDRTVVPRWVRLRYPGGARDAEALLRVPDGAPGAGRLVVVSKRVFGGGVYLAPERPTGGVNRLERHADAPGLVTGGAFWPDGEHLLLRSYERAWVFTWPGMREVGSIDLPDQQQGEALAVDPAGRVLLSSEGVRRPVVVAPLPDRVRRVLAGERGSGGAGQARSTSSPGTPSPTGAPSPAPTGVDGPRGADDDVSDDAGTAGGPWGWLLAGAALLLVGLALAAARWRHGHQRRAG